MIWLASYPRSGNTFFRIVLNEVYGITSCPLNEKNRSEPDVLKGFLVWKTHLLPDQIPQFDANAHKVVYLVRDGRDSVVSMAHHKKDIVEPGSKYRENLYHSIRAKNGAYFGGWGLHVKAWLPYADLVIRFEDLISQPIQEVEKLRGIFDLPQPDVEKLPTFEDLRNRNDILYAKRKKKSAEENEAIRKKFFRKGKSGAWKSELPFWAHQLFWWKHGNMMKELNYMEGKPFWA